MGTEDQVLKGTKLITNTKKQRLKIQSRGQALKSTILKTQNKQKIKIKIKHKAKSITKIIKKIYKKFALKIRSFFAR